MLIEPAIDLPAVVAKSAVSYKFAGVCGFFAADFLQIFDVIRWRVCGCGVALFCSAFLCSFF